MVILPCFIANDLVRLNSNDIYGGFPTDFSLMGVVILKVFLFSYSIEHLHWFVLFVDWAVDQVWLGVSYSIFQVDFIF